MMGRRRHSARVELTPLMDVMFLVLAYFIYCVFEMSVHRGMKVDLPDAAGVHESGERIVLTIAADGSMQINGQPTSRDAVVDKVRKLYSANVKMPVLVSGDRRATFGSGIELLSELKRAGVDRVSVQVEKRQGGR